MSLIKLIHQFNGNTYIAYEKQLFYYCSIAKCLISSYSAKYPINMLMYKKKPPSKTIYIRYLNFSQLNV